MMIRRRLAFRTTDIYRAEELVGHVFSEEGTNWALIRLNRPVENRPTARIRRDGMIAAEQPVYVMGHPVGLPLKFRRWRGSAGQFSAHIFLRKPRHYGGNSGSPVLRIIGANGEPCTRIR